MQLLSGANNKAETPQQCAESILEVVPVIVWFIRHHMRMHRRGLSIPQFRMLVQVDRRPSASLSTLADCVGASPPTASRMVDGLTNKGLLKRKESVSDRRQIAVEITAKGREVLQIARSATLNHLTAELDKLTESQRVELARSMEVMRELFDSPPLDSPAEESGSVVSSR